MGELSYDDYNRISEVISLIANGTIKKADISTTNNFIATIYKVKDIIRIDIKETA